MGKGLDIQIAANGSYRKMNKDGKAWTARLSHVIYRITPTTLEKPYLNPDWVESVSYTHLDVYKRQTLCTGSFPNEGN